jgi:hypothetical protein
MLYLNCIRLKNEFDPANSEIKSKPGSIYNLMVENRRMYG